MDIPVGNGNFQTLPSFMQSLRYHTFYTSLRRLGVSPQQMGVCYHHVTAGFINTIGQWHSSRLGKRETININVATRLKTSIQWYWAGSLRFIYQIRWRITFSPRAQHLRPRPAVSQRMRIFFFTAAAPTSWWSVPCHNPACQTSEADVRLGEAGRFCSCRCCPSQDWKERQRLGSRARGQAQKTNLFFPANLLASLKIPSSILRRVVLFPFRRFFYFFLYFL